jgi:hypothetical protein
MIDLTAREEVFVIWPCGIVGIFYPWTCPSERGSSLIRTTKHRSIIDTEIMGFV